jgi:hypothetical protein
MFALIKCNSFARLVELSGDPQYTLVSQYLVELVHVWCSDHPQPANTTITTSNRSNKKH